MLKYYLSFLGFSLLAVSALNVLLGNSILFSFLSVFLGAVFIFLLDAFIAWVIHALPQEWFDCNKKIFVVNKKERKIYEKLKIKSWKDKVPEMGQLCNFKKNKIASLDTNYLNKFLTETCYAEIVHYGMLIIGVCIFFVYSIENSFNIALPLFLINAILQIPPIMIQRYNRPKLINVLIREQRKVKKID